jgi:hypothetical protein
MPSASGYREIEVWLSALNMWDFSAISPKISYQFRHEPSVSQYFESRERMTLVLL